jgi:hypothetical protein
MPQSPTTKSTAAGDESVKFSLSSTSLSHDDLEASAASVRLVGPGGYGGISMIWALQPGTGGCKASRL